MDSVVCLLTTDWPTFPTFRVCTVATGKVCCGQVGVCVSLRRRRRATTPRRAAGASHLVRGRAAARRDLSWETNGGASHAARRQPASPPTCVTSVSLGRPAVMLACWCRLVQSVTGACVRGRTAREYPGKARLCRPFLTDVNLQLIGGSLRVKGLPQFNEQQFDDCATHFLPLLVPRFTRTSEPAI